MTPPPRVAICVPFVLDLCPSDFAMSLAALMYRVGASTGVELSLLHHSGSIITDARTSLVRRALEADATHVLFLDSDMVFPPDTLARLLAHKVPIVGASYVRRFPPHNMLGAMLTNTEANAFRPDLAQMAHIPLGCALIATTVFKNWQVADEDVVWFKYVENKSEDTYFCEMARARGHTIWLDPSLTAQLGHCGMVVHRPKAPHRTNDEV